MSSKQRITAKFTPRRNRLATSITLALLAGTAFPATGWAATIQGNVFLDANNNGLKDTGEKPRASQTVFLRNNDLANEGEGSFYTVTTDANGNYSFMSQLAGSFTLWTGIPTGWQQTAPKKGQNMVPYDFTVASTTQTVTVNFGLLDHPNTLPTIKLSSTSVTATAGEIFNFTATASDSDVGDTLVYKWDFGDGNTATSLTTSYTYATAGTYTATLTVTDDRGGVATGKLTVTVKEPLIKITSTQTTFSIDAGQSVDLAATFTDVSGIGPFSYVWKFGDGNTATGSVTKVGNLTVKHVYNQSGSLTATLEITDKSGNKSTKQFVVQVRGVDSNPCEVTPTAQSQRAWGLWDDTTTWSAGKVPGANDWVLIKAGNTVVLPATAVSSASSELQVKGLCMEPNAVLQSDYNVLDLPSSWVNLNVTTLYNKGIIRGANGVNAGTVNGVYKIATGGSSLKIFASNIVNDTTGIVGGTTGGRGGDDLPYLLLATGQVRNSIGGNGGQIELYPNMLTNRGRIESGKGGNAFNNINGKENLSTDDPLIVQTGVEILGTASAGNGGFVRVFPTDINTSTSSGPVVGGCGGSAYARADSARTAGTSTDVSINVGKLSGQAQGCQGSRAHWNPPTPPAPPPAQTCRPFWFFGRFLPWSCWWRPPVIQATVIQATVISWFSRIFRHEPTLLEYTSDTRIDNQDEVVIFGGEDAYIDMTQLSEGAISADKTITIATGPGGTVDLRGVSSKVFNAGEKLEIFSDNIQLDDGVTVADLTTAPAVEINPAKILYAPSWSSPDHLAGEPGTTLPVTFTLHNGGPAEDTYTLSITGTSGWEIGTLPAEPVTVESMRHSDLTVEVTLPKTRGDNDILTITATSQSDPTVKTVAYVRVSVMEEEAITPRTGEKADLTLVIDNTASMGGEIQTVANALEDFLTTQLEAGIKPTIELITFKDEAVSRVVTKDMAEIIGRVRSIRHSGGGDCPNASVGALEYALSNLNPKGQIILATAASAEKDANAVVSKLQAQGVKVNVLLAGSCDNEAADKAFYQGITDNTGGTFKWLPRGGDATATETLAKVTTEVVTKAIEEAVQIKTTTGTEGTNTGSGTTGTTTTTGTTDTTSTTGTTATTGTTGTTTTTGTTGTTSTTGTTATTTTGSDKASGIISDKFGKPVANATVKVGDQTVTTNAQGRWEMPNLPEGKYPVTVSVPGYVSLSKTCEVSADQPCSLDLSKQLSSLLKLKVTPQPAGTVKQGDNVTYTVTVTNTGQEPATGVVLNEVLPAATTLVSMATLNGSGQCDNHQLTCTLPDLAAGASAQVKLVVKNTQTNQLENTITVSSNNYPADVIKTWTAVQPYLSVTVKDTPDPVAMQGQLHYNYTVDLSKYATENATGITLVTQLPSGVEIQSAKSDLGTCDTSKLPTVTCPLPDLKAGSNTAANIDVLLKDPGLLVLTNEAKVTATNYPAHIVRERTNIFIPDNIKVDLAFVIDTTGSMQQEINGVIAAIKKFVAEMDTTQSPTMALIEFKDDVTVKAFTQDPKVLLKVAEGLKASGGGLCPEASAEALEVAVKHLKDGGVIMFSTDASPYDDANLAGLANLIGSKNMKFHAFVTGDCTQKDSWNEMTK